MDPNTLDSKLKATYDRVMGTQTASAQAGPTTASSAVNPVIATTAAPLAPGASQQPVSPTPSAAYTSDNLSFQAAIQTPITAGTPVAATGQTIPRQPSTLLKLLYIIGAIVFFVVYAFVWIKIFNLPLPF